MVIKIVGIDLPLTERGFFWYWSCEACGIEGAPRTAEEAAGGATAHIRTAHMAPRHSRGTRR